MCGQHPFCVYFFLQIGIIVFFLSGHHLCAGKEVDLITAEVQHKCLLYVPCAGQGSGWSTLKTLPTGGWNASWLAVLTHHWKLLSRWKCFPFSKHLKSWELITIIMRILKDISQLSCSSCIATIDFFYLQSIFITPCIKCQNTTWSNLILKEIFSHLTKHVDWFF